MGATMAESLDELLARTVKAVIRESLDDLRPAIASALKDAGAGQDRTSPTYVTVKEAARMMTAHPVTVRKLIADGKLGRYSVEGQLRVKVSDIHAYMARAGQSSPTIDLDERARALLSRPR
jgi:excisionase family DNA binding protein